MLDGIRLIKIFLFLSIATNMFSKSLASNFPTSSFSVRYPSYQSCREHAHHFPRLFSANSAAVCLMSSEIASQVRGNVNVPTKQCYYTTCQVLSAMPCIMSLLSVLRLPFLCVCFAQHMSSRCSAFLTLALACLRNRRAVCEQIASFSLLASLRILRPVVRVLV
jgi:hypothetical protein